MHQPGGIKDTTRMLTHYMAWGNEVIMNSVAKLPGDEITKPRQSLFRDIAHSFQHIFVIGHIFRAHLEGRDHGYAARNTEHYPPFPEIRSQINAIDRYYIDLAEGISEEELNEVVHFRFVDGGPGAMTRQQILLHLSNHATYHRGFVCDILYQIPFVPDSNDLSVFLRDAWPALSA